MQTSPSRTSSAFFACFFWFVLATILCPPASAVSVSGWVAGADTGSTFGTYVLLQGLSQKHAVPVSNSQRIVQKDLQFHPRLVAIKVGDTLTVSDSDIVTHNVRIVKGKRQVLNKLTFNGMSVSHRFTEEGTYQLQCNIHPAMRGRVIVLPAPFKMSQVKTDGTFAFELSNRAEGSVTIRVWTEQHGLTEGQRIDLTDLDQRGGIRLDAH